MPAKPMFASSTRTFFSPMARESSVRIAGVSLIGFSPGFVQELCDNLSELCLSENVACVGGKERFGSYTGMMAGRSPNANAFFLTATAAVVDFD